MKCIRCGESFMGVESAERCERAPDAGGHEALPHAFVSGRLDGLCGRPQNTGGSCGYERGDERIHYQHETIGLPLPEVDAEQEALVGGWL